MILSALVERVLGSAEDVWGVPASSVWTSTIRREGLEQFPMELLERLPRRRDSLGGDAGVESRAGERGGVLGSH